MRYSQVSEKGIYSKPPHPKLALGGMVDVRTRMNRGGALKLAQACTIATRYCAVRRQFSVNNTHKLKLGLKSNEETPVILYPMVQWRVFPRIAESYAIMFASHYMEKMYHQMEKQLEQRVLTLLPIVHATSSALKSYCSNVVAEGIEELRKACGGHGYLNSSGFSYLYTNYVPSVTYEGENYLLTQQDFVTDFPIFVETISYISTKWT